MADRVNTSELHRVTGIDRATIGKRLANLPHTIGKKSAKEYDRKSALTILMTKDTSVGGDALNGHAPDAKARRELADAERAELRVAQIKGELVSADAMRSAAAELVKTLYQRIVRVEPAIIASLCIGKSAIEIETTVRDAMTTVFNELKLDLTAFISIDDVEADIEVEDGSDSES